ncbi:PREDICTED: centrosomal protein of 97 kDa isoform X2 [Nicrophorus vespilloides]|uniref:Centrosomal protein of 97 kDa isoform X2 n=1 Tax=Nicrophorus vespilloides TaxID=110193 RepID=A0ABM1NHB9_NICVS|nr:PREDICTED: centrosomal protein of 97 kDa isoform X2 [Nicrophorus vespilloides]
MDNIQEILDFSSKKLKKLNKPQQVEVQAVTLILDDNDLQRLDNIDTFIKLQKLSAVRNHLLRMNGVFRLQNLQTLNLAHNNILTIEGLKELAQLKFLNLAGNNIKTIEHLNTNVNLEHLDLSENMITHVTDLSFLRNLKELLLHNNKISHLRQCERFLPNSLVTLTIASNNIQDLNEISQLVNLINLNSISIASNPCVNMIDNKIGFNYRPFIINWCLSVKVVDGYMVNAIESLKGEWLYSQGRGRHFRVGDHQELCQYLTSVCPVTGELLETEEDRKLRLILSKAQHHQQQLREQGNSPIPSPSVRKKFHGSKHSPRLNSSRLSSRSKSPDKMSSSCYNNSNNIMDNSCIMTQSLDPSLLNQTPIIDPMRDTNGICLDDTEPINSPLQALSKLVPVPESLMSPDYRPSPLVSRLAALGTPTNINIKSTPKMVAPMKSPKMTRSQIAKPRTNLNIDNRRNNSPSPVRNRKNMNGKPNTPPTNHKPLVSAMKKSPSTEDESEMCDAKLQTIQMKAEERRMQKDNEISSNSSGDEKAEMAAIFIQKMWRGFYARNRDKNVQDAYKCLQAQRADEYLKKLATDMESTKAALESERKIQMLQMQAINALWKKVSALQPETSNDTQPSVAASNQSVNSFGSLDNTAIVNNLAQTCTSLQTQIQQLQGSMQDIAKFMSFFSQIQPTLNQQFKETVAGTQTEIIAVHTPQGEGAKNFPFQKQARPSSLPLPVNQKNQQRRSEPLDADVRQFAGSLVDGVIKTVSETRADCFGVAQNTEITVTDMERNCEEAKEAYQEN